MKAIHNRCLFEETRWSAVNYTQRYKKWKQFTTSIDCYGRALQLWTIHKDTKNESNSQLCSFSRLFQNAVNYTQRYKKWKQFTTYPYKLRRGTLLWTIHKDTKNESNSQHFLDIYSARWRCELYTKIQKMKAIHNWIRWRVYASSLWTIHKDTKNESNSQPQLGAGLPHYRCELYTKIQKMKAIHNGTVPQV